MTQIHNGAADLTHFQIFVAQSSRSTFNIHLGAYTTRTAEILPFLGEQYEFVLWNQYLLGVLGKLLYL